MKITAKKGSVDLKGGEVIGYMATNLSNVTSVAYEAAKEIAEGRVVEHPIQPKTVEEKPSNNNNDGLAKWLATISGLFLFCLIKTVYLLLLFKKKKRWRF